MRSDEPRGTGDQGPHKGAAYSRGPVTAERVPSLPARQAARVEDQLVGSFLKLNDDRDILPPADRPSGEVSVTSSDDRPLVALE